jgi:predicted ATPase/DNA-binding CsgD family transcriptional regulator
MTTPAAIPIPMTPLIGRDFELIDVEVLLRRSETRLVTITGPGGVGKTRLALQLAQSLRGAFPDGLWYVPLESIRSAELVIPTLAQAVGVADDGSGDPGEALAAALGSGDCLFILDNVEQVAEASPLLGTLLQRCAGLKMLVTSRTSLGIPGEREYPLSPLLVPGDDGDMAALMAAPAIALFVERAREVDPRFALTDENAGAVRAICQRLDGLPLAIELAAARIKVLTPAALLDRLGNRLQVLTSRNRNLPERQQTMRGAIAWSYELLSPVDQRLFRLLSVFNGGFDLPALEAVVGHLDVEAPPDAFELLDQITSLVDQSLVRQVDRGADQPRFAMFQTIDEYAEAELESQGEAQAARRAHAEWVIALIEVDAPRLSGPDQVELLDRFETEHDNIRAALTYAIEQEDASLAHRIGALLWNFWHLRGHQQEGRRWYELILALPAGEPTLDYAYCLRGAGEIASEQGRFAEAARLYEEALAIVRPLGEKRLEAQIIGPLANTAFGQGNFDEASRLYHEAIAIHDTTDDRRSLATSYNNLGNISLYLNRLDDAEAEYSRARDLLLELGDRRGALVVLGNIGSVVRYRGELERSARIHQDVLAEMREIGDERGIASALSNLGLAFTDLGDLDQAKAYCLQAIEILERIGLVRMIALAQLSVADIAMRRGDNVEAIDWATRSLGNLVACGDVPSSGVLLGMLGDLAFNVGQPVRSARLFGGALAQIEAANAQEAISDPDEYEQTVARTRDALGVAAYDAEFATGKATPLDELLRAARELREIAISAPGDPESAAIEQRTGLNAREVQALRLLVAGRSNQEIADEIGISLAEGTALVGRVLTRIGVESRAEATAYAFKNGLV